MTDLVPSRSVLLELRDERRVLEEGYAFLDEKRALVAAEIILQLRRYHRVRRRRAESWASALQALRRAVLAHGLHELLGRAEEAVEGGAVPLRMQRRMLLGISLLETAEPASEAQDAQDGGLLEACRAAFRALLLDAAEEAALVGNLHRLHEDYQQTERRARGLEEVLIPELDAQAAELEGILESQDLEEAIWRKTLLSRRG